MFLLVKESEEACILELGTVLGSKEQSLHQYTLTHLSDPRN